MNSGSSVQSHDERCTARGCETCMTADRVLTLRGELDALERALAQLCKAQRISTLDLLKTIDARRQS